MRTIVSWAAVAVAIAAAPALAQPAAARFSLVSGETVAQGADLASALLGWPGVEFGYRHGLTDSLDAGLTAGLLYSLEGTTSTVFGVAMGAPIRATFLRKDALSAQVSFTPGVTLYATSPAGFGFNFPVGAVVGLQITPELRLAVGADVGMKLAVTGPGGAAFEFAPLFGPALEYYVDRSFSVSLDTRVGPIITTGGGPAQLSFRAQAGLAYRFGR